MTTSETEDVISFRNVVAGYGTKVILEDVNLDIHRGQITALLGGSGSGKSTLLKMMIGLLAPLEGEVRLLGEDLYSLEGPERTRVLSRTGMLFQYGALFGSRTVFENISLPLRQHTELDEPIIKEMVRMKLALVGLAGLENRLPSDISGGQRKRVALARATILDPEVLFADEPSAGLDPIVAAGLDDSLRRFQELFGMTMIVVTHELESIKALADKVIMLNQGRVEA
ncbi:MAG: ABC transporter ATP-binding protein, partial [Bradymonadaceae bacterium]